MLRRFTTHAPTAASPVDDLMAGALPDRVQVAHERLAHQDDPALLTALSERELAASRELAELVRDYERHEQRARIQAAADAAERVRRTAAELAEREAADLLRAAQAIGEQRHSSSPHAKVARLHQRKPRVLGLLAGVVAFSMLFSAVTVQQNIAPTGGVTNPMFWLSYGLEALISAVLVALMLSTGDTAEWGVIERLWQVYTVEGVLLTASIALNTFPYFKTGDLTGIGIHAIAPIMIGVALVTHRLVAERYGRAIEQATAAVPDTEDLQERLVALTRVGGAGNQILPSILDEQHAPPRPSVEPQTTVVERPADVAAPTADADRRETSAAAAAEHPTAQDDIDSAAAAPVPAPPFTELWLATTPLSAGRSAAANPSEADGDNGTDEAELDARLAAAVRKTLHRIKISEQTEPVPAARTERPASVAPDEQSSAQTPVAPDEQTLMEQASSAPRQHSVDRTSAASGELPAVKHAPPTQQQHSVEAAPRDRPVEQAPVASNEQPVVEQASAAPQEDSVKQALAVEREQTTPDSEEEPHEAEPGGLVASESIADDTGDNPVRTQRSVPKEPELSVR
ncbi:hypothetical protein GV794_27820 [Nocardia cyriacigeorgica]|uniref:DUF2637 domain-containing protein n=1 Tax=Nocardia cyriacigeorgica TaxID=135487 RepID=A0A6P1DE51_9NOCA|nr:hypothetical protein [Nocardia cyriacigeorgica]NEW42318.1 hypothetical protein [Nocardia cyriacigeorgica]NEW47921.1 hypothetical protein [Nocardia cyriacigeorgica]NEW59411.1 hypothetical protein [Nocardia cyriacigeorgica]